MLDQNTDRMWYVIGAVLIGAAIIFGMNTLMPDAFASVGSMFEDLLVIISDDDYNRRLKEIGVVEPDGINLLDDQYISGFQLDDFDKDTYSSDGVISFTTRNGTYDGVRLMFEDYSMLEPDTVYTLSYDIEVTDGVLNRIGGHIATPFRLYMSYLDGVRFEYAQPDFRNDLGLTDSHNVVLHFITPKSISMDDVTDDRGIWIQPNRYDRNTPVSAKVSNLRIEKGIVGIN